ncbi:MAG: cytochrome C [Pseudolabrys sp.]
MHRRIYGAWFSLIANGQVTRRSFDPSAFLVIALSAAAFAAFFFGASPKAEALPSFARQTGQPCGTCHVDFPGLTPFGRLFKLNGYTTGGGRFRTALFPSWSKPDRALAAYAHKTVDQNTTLSGRQDTSNIWVPPISGMTVYGYTHTKIDQPMGSPYHANDNAHPVESSIFYGGAITDHIGLFAQVTNETPYGGSAIDPMTGIAVPPDGPCWNCEWGWDNTDLRYANTGSFGLGKGKSPVDGWDFIYGITANNNPGVQDPWNTVPAWGFPYMVSNIADDCCGPPGTLLEGAYEMQVAGAGGYAFINNLVYLELTGYRTLDAKTLPKLGVNPYDTPGPFSGIAPYWRAAVAPHWGRNWWEFGTFGMSAKVRPWAGATATNALGIDVMLPQTFSQTDRYTDIAFDTQYQYQGDNFWITLRGTYIHESQSLNASFNNGLSANPSNTLNSLKAYASLSLGNDNRVVLSGQYFDVWGTQDMLLYADNANFNPKTKGWVAEIAYIPFISSHSPIWPWANVRVGLQYTYYNEFNGTTLDAQDNNSLFLYAWFAM